MRLCPLLLASLALLLTGCGTPSPDLTADAGDGDADGGATLQDGGTGGEADAGQTTDGGTQGCTDLVNGGQQIPETAGVGAFPTPQGGTIEDGTYYLTKFEIYPPGSVDPHVRRHALRITNGRVEAVTQRNSEPERRASGTAAVNGTNVTFTVDCPSGAGGETFGYTVSGNEFRHIKSASQEVHVFTKQ